MFSFTLLVIGTLEILAPPVSGLVYRNKATAISLLQNSEVHLHTAVSTQSLDEIPPTASEQSYQSKPGVSQDDSATPAATSVFETTHAASRVSSPTPTPSPTTDPSTSQSPGISKPRGSGTLPGKSTESSSSAFRSHTHQDFPPPSSSFGRSATLSTSISQSAASITTPEVVQTSTIPDSDTQIPVVTSSAVVGRTTFGSTFVSNSNISGTSTSSTVPLFSTQTPVVMSSAAASQTTSSSAALSNSNISGTVTSPGARQTTSRVSSHASSSKTVRQSTVIHGPITSASSPSQSPTAPTPRPSSEEDSESDDEPVRDSASPLSATPDAPTAVSVYFDPSSAKQLGHSTASVSPSPASEPTSSTLSFHSSLSSALPSTSELSSSSFPASPSVSSGAQTPSTAPSSKTGLSLGGIIGIALGAVLLLAVFSGVLFYFCRRSPRRCLRRKRDVVTAVTPYHLPFQQSFPPDSEKALPPRNDIVEVPHVGTFVMATAPANSVDTKSERSIGTPEIARSHAALYVVNRDEEREKVSRALKAFSFPRTPGGSLMTAPAEQESTTQDADADDFVVVPL